jgi:hypothetical protein
MRRVRRRHALFVVTFLLGSCETVDLGDNFVAPALQLDEQLFYCRVQPEVLTQYRCSSGESGLDAPGGCHASRSAVRLVEVEEPPPCDGERVVGSVPSSYQMNLENIRLAVQSDPMSSPLYQRPTASDGTHPRKIFDRSDPAAQLILQWISGGAR